MSETQATPPKSRFILWLKRIGFWGFLFFLIKGLLWLALGYWIAKK